MKNVDIYTDGACSGNPGIGGWCAVLLYGGHEKRLSGGENETTNNRMEVYAAIAGLSAYLVNAVELGWLNGWKRGRWINSQGKPVKNRDLWEELSKLTEFHDVTFIKVKGHADNEYNNICDKEARAAIEKIKGF